MIAQRPSQKLYVIGNDALKVVASKPAAAAGIYLQDSFTGANGTPLNGRTPDIGANWFSNGTHRISGNQAEIVERDIPIVSDCGVSDGTITVTRDDGWSYIVARYTDDNNWWRCGWFGDPGIGVGLKLVEINAGVATERGDAGTYADFASLKVVLNGTTIEVWTGSTLRISYASATFNQSATKHGIGGYQGGRLLDNILMVPNA